MDLDHKVCYRAICARDARFDGRFFTAVNTTGIDCRPICPARTPRRENIAFYRSAAAAQEAGFRPCLRCRPETAPDLGAWRGTSNTVSRALALIEMGALDEAGVERLAERLGVGERHLRRLFRRHLGAPPVAVAQTRRVLLAKQLIHETRLPMVEIALAAGFGSVRRFNETFRQLFRGPPGVLRRSRAAESSSGLSGEVTIFLRYRPPYDWAAMSSYLQARAIPGVEVISGDDYARTIEIGGLRGTVSVRPASLSAARDHSISKTPGPSGDYRAAATAVRSCRRPRRDRCRACGRPGAGSFDCGAAGAARPRRLGWLRTRHSRRPGPTDHGVRRDEPGRKAGCGLWRTARRNGLGGDGLSHISRAQSVWRGPISRRLAFPAARRGSFVLGSGRVGGFRKSLAFEAISRTRSSGFVRFRESANGRHTILPCESCESRTRFRLPILD